MRQFNWDPPRTLGGSAFRYAPDLLASGRQVTGASMSTDASDDLTDEERVLFGAYGVAADLAARCRQLTDMNVSVSPRALQEIVNTLMTEFWDQGFSQTEIRNAFMAATADMNRYAAGQERR